MKCFNLSDLENQTTFTLKLPVCFPEIRMLIRSTSPAFHSYSSWRNADIDVRGANTVPKLPSTRYGNRSSDSEILPNNPVNKLGLVGKPKL